MLILPSGLVCEKYRQSRVGYLVEFVICLFRRTLMVRSTKTTSYTQENQSEKIMLHSFVHILFMSAF